MRVKAYLGLGSRYSYLASTQLDRIAERAGATFEWIPVNSVELIRRARPDGSPFDQPSPGGQYSATFRDEDAKRWAAHYGVAYHSPRISSLPSEALACACWCLEDDQARRAFMQALYDAIFVQGRVMDMDRLSSLAGDFGVSAEALQLAVRGGQASERHANALERALASGAFGVPTFVVGEALFWGNDRLPLLEDYLSSGSD